MRGWTHRNFSEVVLFTKPIPSVKSFLIKTWKSTQSLRIQFYCDMKLRCWVVGFTATQLRIPKEQILTHICVAISQLLQQSLRLILQRRGKGIRVMSPNVTSWCHPMDHGDIRTMKKKYRWIFVQSLADVIGKEGEVSICVKKLNPMLLIGQPNLGRESSKNTDAIV